VNFQSEMETNSKVVAVIGAGMAGLGENVNVILIDSLCQISVGRRARSYGI
jgi:hypothetical protein